MAKTSTQDWLSIIAIGLAAFAIILVVAKGGQEFVLQQQEQDTLSVSGNSEVFVDPNKAEIFVRVETRDPDAQEAQEQNRETSDAVMQALEDAGVEEDQIETTQYSLNRETRWNPETREQEVEGYVLRNVMKVTTEDLEAVGEIIDAAVEAGANGVDNVQFGLTDERMQQAQDEALNKAAGMSKEKAESLADSLGVSLGNPVRISESQYDFIPYRASMDMAMAESGGEGAAPTKLSPQQVQIQARVSVDYSIN